MSNIPTIDVYRDGKHARINRSDLAAWTADGWSPEPAKEPVTPPGPKKDPEPAKEPVTPPGPKKDPEPAKEPTKDRVKPKPKLTK